ncbi:hypothetical protein L202_06241 [Cryptococcus amylolentus CBS 6039]|uniref:Uncharacterized protein n=2 Tax=Cryptococcus amylolentus TaxID=104669 RepID=A0A1E3HIZ8_9TREE|nr:hypothetical protein L202_06241 [Cryptococcus amylolentus CBS 6039]ODN76314.1 hypothetical protein L202_06241 [Cryptococcus amylolentus CBS 6039]ODN96227.1 hypothetical protein I350_08225 [Cryptococcus amylolentus CBS 6273]
MPSSTKAAAQARSVPKFNVVIRWSADPQQICRLLSIIKSNPLWRQACFPQGITTVPKLYKIYVDIFLVFCENDPAMRDAEREGLVKRVKGDGTQKKWEATERFSSRVGNPVRRKIDSLKSALKSGTYTNKFHPSWKRWSNVPKHTRASLQAEHPYYFQLLELAQSSSEFVLPPRSADDEARQSGRKRKLQPSLDVEDHRGSRVGIHKRPRIASPSLSYQAESEMEADDNDNTEPPASRSNQPPSSVQALSSRGNTTTVAPPQLASASIEALTECQLATDKEILALFRANPDLLEAVKRAQGFEDSPPKRRKVVPSLSPVEMARALSIARARPRSFRYPNRYNDDVSGGFLFCLRRLLGFAKDIRRAFRPEIFLAWCDHMGLFDLQALFVDYPPFTDWEECFFGLSAAGVRFLWQKFQDRQGVTSVAGLELVLSFVPPLPQCSPVNLEVLWTISSSHGAATAEEIRQDLLEWKDEDGLPFLSSLGLIRSTPLNRTERGSWRVQGEPNWGAVHLTQGDKRWVYNKAKWMT